MLNLPHAPLDWFYLASLILIQVAFPYRRHLHILAYSKSWLKPNLTSQCTQKSWVLFSWIFCSVFHADSWALTHSNHSITSFSSSHPQNISAMSFLFDCWDTFYSGYLVKDVLNKKLDQMITLLPATASQDECITMLWGTPELSLLAVNEQDYVTRGQVLPDSPIFTYWQ